MIAGGHQFPEDIAPSLKEKSTTICNESCPEI